VCREEQTSFELLDWCRNLKGKVPLPLHLLIFTLDSNLSVQYASKIFETTLFSFLFNY